MDTIRTDLDPAPYETPKERTGIAWPVATEITWPPVVNPPPADFREVVERRRSSRVMTSAPFRQLVNLITFALAPRFENLAGRIRAPSLSAGALHAVDVVLLTRGRLFRFDRRRATLQKLRLSDRKTLSCFCERAHELLPQANAAIIVLIGDLPRISAFYAEPGSLLFRDAGALLQTLALATEAYGLGFCPLGLLGKELVESLGLDLAMAIPLGTAVLGSTCTKQG